MTPYESCEWLEADGLGGFASGPATGGRTRRYHALLLTATTPPTGRIVLVNGFDAWVDTGGSSYGLSTQRYTPEVDYPDGASRIERFEPRPWPQWVSGLPNGQQIEHAVLVEHGTGTVVLSWRLLDTRAAHGTTVAAAAAAGHSTGTAAPDESAAPQTACVLRVRPFFSGRDYHALHHRNDAFRFVPHSHGARTTFSPYVGVPSIVIESNGRYFHQPDWYLNFSYRQEEERGLDSVEDLAAPGEWHFALVPGRPAFMMLSAQSVQPSATDRQRTRDAWAASNAVETVDGPGPDDVRRRAECIMERERERRARLDDPLHAAADAYVVRRGQGKTIVAGYPWFTDWGRDTFIAVRGLCLIGDRAADARDMLVEWSGAVSEGMLPNRFPDSGEQPEYNSVDASLWFVVAAAELLDLHERGGVDISDAGRRAITRAIEQIVAGYTSGTRYGIRADSDGLLRCGVANSQLTWMDARVDGRSITPRVGKPVEVQALWINALAAAERLGLPTTVSVRDATRVFADRFWYEESGSLADVVDVDHVAGTRDMTCRPNQILAVGGLPVPLLDERQAAAVVRTVERRLLTPVGLRSLAPDEPGYVGIYAGGAAARDGAYHQGTVWPWLIGAFVDAWLRVHGRTKEATRDARRRFFAPLSDHLHTAGLGHVSEIADGDAPHMARGCPFQAWSLGELMRVDRLTREGEIA